MKNIDWEKVVLWIVIIIAWILLSPIIILALIINAIKEFIGTLIEVMRYIIDYSKATISEVYESGVL